MVFGIITGAGTVRGHVPVVMLQHGYAVVTVVLIALGTGYVVGRIVLVEPVLLLLLSMFHGGTMRLLLVVLVVHPGRVQIRLNRHGHDDRGN